MLIDSDIKKLKNVFATKDELSHSINEVIERMGEMKDEIKREVIGELREDLISFKDEILGEIKSLREEVTIVGGYRDIIEDHEKRILHLERKKKTN